MITTQQVFHSKVDGWLGCLLIGVTAVSLYALFSAYFTHQEGGNLVGYVILILLGVVLPTWILIDTYYVLTKETLIIRSGPFRWSVDLTDIRDIQPSRTLLSSPALSLDRLKITYTKGVIVISPKDKSAFIEALNARSKFLP